jgi:hypothetical protein
MVLAFLLLLITTAASPTPTVTGAAVEGLCDDWIWPPLGTRFCNGDASCAFRGGGGEDLTCRGCMPSSCSCDPATGRALSCTRDCLAYCRDSQGNIARRMQEDSHQ